MQQPSSVSVLLCRGCCCGTAKHGEVDHDAHAEQLRAALPTGARAYTVDCLGPCEFSNVYVVRSGQTRVWFGEMLADGDVTALARWLERGAAIDAIPSALAQHSFTPPASPTRAAVRSPIAGAELAALVARLASQPPCGLTVGVDGASAEILTGPEADVSQDGTRVHVHSGYADVTIDTAAATGFTITDDDGTLRLLQLAVPDAHAPVGPAAVTLAPDPARQSPNRYAFRALPGRETRTDWGLAGGWLLDLGLGRRTAFAVIVDDAELGDARRFVGRAFSDAAATMWPRFANAAHARALLTPLGRVDIAAGGPTELSLGRLLLERPLPEAFAVPAGWTVAFTLWPSAPG